MIAKMTEPRSTPPTPFDSLLDQIRLIVREEITAAHTDGNNMTTTSSETLLTAAEAAVLMNVKPR
jgi:hypothetical protein